MTYIARRQHQRSLLNLVKTSFNTLFVLTAEAMCVFGDTSSPFFFRTICDTFSN